MKKYYCFYCQQDVAPRHFFKWRFCPHCRHYMTDSGEGFYRICDCCGANMPVDATKCIKCKQNTGLPTQNVKTIDLNNLPLWVMWLLRFAAVAVSIIIGIGILYVSFYLIIVIFAIGLALFLFNLFLPRC